MSRYVDAEIALKTIDNYAKTVSADGKVIVNAIRDIVGVISPTADVVEVRHGHWGFDGLGWTCSECGEYAILGIEKANYCSSCGAKMDGERREG